MHTEKNRVLSFITINSSSTPNTNCNPELVGDDERPNICVSEYIAHGIIDRKLSPDKSKSTLTFLHVWLVHAQCTCGPVHSRVCCQTEASRAPRPPAGTVRSPPRRRWGSAARQKWPGCRSATRLTRRRVTTPWRSQTACRPTPGPLTSLDKVTVHKHTLTSHSFEF